MRVRLTKGRDVMCVLPQQTEHWLGFGWRIDQPNEDPIPPSRLNIKTLRKTAVDLDIEFDDNTTKAELIDLIEAATDAAGGTSNG